MTRSPHRLLPALPRRAWLLICGMGFGCVGTGFAYSFLVLYLHYGRGLSLGLSGLCLSLVAVGGLAVAPLVGICADRFGPRRVLVTALLVSAGGALLLAVASRPWEAVCVALVFGVGSVSIDAPEMALLAVVVRHEQRSAAFALSYAAFSAGLSAGALLGGWFIDLHRPATFQVAFALAAVPYVVYAVVVWRLRGHLLQLPSDAPEPSPVSPEKSSPAADTAVAGPVGDGAGRRWARAAGYGQVLRDHAFALLLLFNFAIFAVSFSQLNAAYPAYAVGVGHSTTRIVGLGLGANAVVILLAQLVVLRLLTGRRRTRALALACGMAALCWLVVLWSAHAGGTLAAWGFVLSVAILGLGETALSPSLYPMANDLAPDRLRGRYNALMFMTEGGGRVVGPLIAGFLLAAGAGDGLMVGLAIAMAATAGFTLLMERTVPASANVITASDAEDDAPATTGTALLTGAGGA
jgi:MFS family permease